ncbi:hypothetical protein [Aeromonas simiae]|nr:hypothetical protein [Aeromonas simiae]
MNLTLSNLIQRIPIKALKLLGPAIVAAIATYKAAALQFNATLQQLRENNELTARQHLFDYYKERQKRLSKGYSSLTYSMDQVLRVNASVAEELPNGALKEIVDSFTSIAQLHLRSTIRNKAGIT